MKKVIEKLNVNMRTTTMIAHNARHPLKIITFSSPTYCSISKNSFANEKVLSRPYFVSMSRISYKKSTPSVAI